MPTVSYLNGALALLMHMRTIIRWVHSVCIVLPHTICSRSVPSLCRVITRLRNR